MNRGAPVEFGREFVEHLISKMEEAPRNCDNMKMVNKSNDLNMGTCKVEKKLGEGSEGGVYSFCCAGGCNYIIKAYRTVKPQAQIDAEVENSKALSAKGLSPKVYDAWYCGKKAFVVYEKVNGKSLAEYIAHAMVQAYKTHNTEIARQDAYQDIIGAANTAANALLQKMLSQNIVHNDFNVDNIMVVGNSLKNLKVIDLGDVVVNAGQRLISDRGENQKNMVYADPAWKFWIWHKLQDTPGVNAAMMKSFRMARE